MNKLFLATLAILALTTAVRAQRNDNIDITVNVDSDSKAYHQFKTREGSFNYGYNVAKQNFNQFQHKVRGPDDVTYGCYGFIDPKNGTHIYHYVSDLKGYRVVPPNKPTNIYRQRVADSVKQLLEAVEEKLPWERLYFPEVCRYLYLSHKESNKFMLPPEYVVQEDGTVMKEATKPPQTSKANVPSPVQTVVTPDASIQRDTTTRQPAPTNVPFRYSSVPANATPRPAPVPTTRRATVLNQQPQSPVRVVPSPTRATLAPPTAAPQPPTSPKQIKNDFTNDLNNFPSKIVPKPIENPLAPKPTTGPVEVRRPNVPQATTKLETVLLPNNQKDIDAIGQDVREVKASLKKLIEHILSRKADCGTPNARAPASVQPATGGHVTAYLPLVLADFPSGSVPVGPSAPIAAIPTAGDAHHSGAVKLALPAYPAYQPPQCPVCRSNSDKK